MAKYRFRLAPEVYVPAYGLGVFWAWKYYWDAPFFIVLIFGIWFIPITGIPFYVIDLLRDKYRKDADKHY
jgi:fatty acid desaturase